MKIKEILNQTDHLELKKLTFDYPRFQNLIQNQPDRIHYSKGVQVVAWGKNRL